jgi:hypothetical protein
MTLKPEDLVVTSFATGDDAFRLVKTGPATDPVTDPNEPTPATHCYVCPEETQTCP